MGDHTQQESANRLKGLFPIITFLGGAWLFVLNKIDALTIPELVADRIPGLVFVHIVITWYFVVGLYLLHRAGIGSVVHVSEEKILREWQISANFYQTWITATFACVAIILVSSFAGNRIDVCIGCYLVCFSVGAYIVSEYDLLHTAKVVRAHLIAVVIFGLAYILLAVLAFSNIETITDKKIYASDDIVRFSVVPVGYIFLPQVNLVSYGHDYILYDRESEHTVQPSGFAVRLSEFSKHPDYLIVRYRLQILEIEKTKFVRLAIAPK